MAEYDTVIFHIDVNSAFLSWESLLRISRGESDLRHIPAVIGGDEAARHGIVLAKSTLAKSCGIVTGEPLMRARQKCPDLVVARPHYSHFVKCSNAFMDLLRKYAPVVEQYSIDEAFCDMTGTKKLYGDFITFAHRLKDEIYDTLGFSVNIGISTNKLLAKMASDFEKPNRVHTLFPEEIPTKLWPLSVDELFFVGSSTAAKLHRLGIHTIGELAHTDVHILTYHFKKHGEVIHDYANGRDVNILTNHHAASKGYGNSTTLSYDVTDRETARRIILSLCETVGARIRADKAYISVVSVNMTDCEFNHFSRQTTLPSSTNITEVIYDTACRLFDEGWNHAPLRLIGVSTSKAGSEKYEQYDLFDMIPSQDSAEKSSRPAFLPRNERLEKLNGAIDRIRDRFGEDSVKRACFIDSDEAHMTGGINKAKRTNAKES